MKDITAFAALSDREKTATMAALKGVGTGAQKGGKDIISIIKKLIGQNKGQALRQTPASKWERAGYGGVFGALGGTAGVGASKGIRSALNSGEAS